MWFYKNDGDIMNMFYTYVLQSSFLVATPVQQSKTNLSHMQKVYVPIMMTADARS